MARENIGTSNVLELFCYTKLTRSLSTRACDPPCRRNPSLSANALLGVNIVLPPLSRQRFSRCPAFAADGGQPKTENDSDTASVTWTLRLPVLATLASEHSIFRPFHSALLFLPGLTTHLYVFRVTDWHSSIELEENFVLPHPDP